MGQFLLNCWTSLSRETVCRWRVATPRLRKGSRADHLQKTTSSSTSRISTERKERRWIEFIQKSIVQGASLQTLSSGSRELESSLKINETVRNSSFESGRNNQDPSLDNKLLDKAKWYCEKKSGRWKPVTVGTSTVNGKCSHGTKVQQPERHQNRRKLQNAQRSFTEMVAL